MRCFSLYAVAFFLLLPASLATAQTMPAPEKKFELTLGGLSVDGFIKPRHAFCVADSAKKMKDGQNISPELRWKNPPEGTKSFAVLAIDADVPTAFDDANQNGKTIAEDFPRRDFVHWVMVDIPAKFKRLPEGADSFRLEKEGKRTAVTKYGLRGVNDYGSFMNGTFFGYDGPCPPWNDARVHRYTFTVYALSVPTLGLSGNFTAGDVKKAMEGHVLASASAVGKYTQNLQLTAK